MKPLSLLLLLFALGSTAWAQSREALEKLHQDGNYKEAYDGFRKLVLSDPSRIGEDLPLGTSALKNLQRQEELDAFLESVVQAHPKNWRVFLAAAREYSDSPHYGSVIAGTFYRGSYRGEGRYVVCEDRDRVRSLQLLVEAGGLVSDERDKIGASEIYRQLAETLNASGRGFWKLQQLTDLSVLPEYEESRYYSAGTTGAPVGEDGKPVFFSVPSSWESAKNDGERFRWALAMQEELSPLSRDANTLLLADLWRSQYGVQTLAYFARDREPQETGAFAVHTLGETETIARLATGVTRFTLPDEFNFIRLYQQLAEKRDSSQGEVALGRLASVFEDRRQYPRAAEYWKQSIERFGRTDEKQEHLDQIVGAWGRFETLKPLGSDGPLTVDYRFRNGTGAAFEAYALNIKRLLEDVKGYLKSNPRSLEWDKVQIEEIGARIVEENESQYREKLVAQWNERLTPKPDHFDTRTAVTIPVKGAGAYLLTARIAGGNTSHIVVWVPDTVIVKKPLAESELYFVADARTGKPLSGVRLELFGYRTVSRDSRTASDRLLGRHYDVVTSELSAETDERGIVVPAGLSNDYQWLATVTGPEGRLAFLGFSHYWSSRSYDSEYNQIKTYVITDRPVYRPLQSVKFKIWVARAQYDQEGASPFAGQRFSVRVMNPKQEKLWEQELRSDDFGGLKGEFALPKDAALGVYLLTIENQGRSTLGSSTFRVEEYKKPEFEVTIDAPTEPVMLGETIAATIKAKYYFGAPVTEAKVKYKVLRFTHDAPWFPLGVWDWLFGSGYWWFSPDYDWYPGWLRWGCKRPHPWWWPVRSAPPEVVQEREVAIGRDGVVRVEIDTASAKELHGDTDHRYQITAEVTDQSRRTIDASGEVLLAREPFKVYAWLNHGFVRTGDAVEANFLAQTLSQKPVQGTGKLKLYRVTYSEKAEPTEDLVQEWPLDTDAQGEARLQFTAAAAGQHRVSYTVRDSKGHEIEGGYLFNIVGQGFSGSSYRFNDLELIVDKREYTAGDKVRLMINTNRKDASVLLFVRPANGVYQQPELVTLSSKSVVREIPITKKDMPNFFIEALTVSGAKVFTELRQIAVPPESRVLNVSVEPAKASFKPGEQASAKLRVTDLQGKPVVASLVLSVYDKAVEYIAGRSNVPEIKEFFWKWRRSHTLAQQTSLDRASPNLVEKNARGMRAIGALGSGVADDLETMSTVRRKGVAYKSKEEAFSLESDFLVAPEMLSKAEILSSGAGAIAPAAAAAPAPEPGAVAPKPAAVRKEFADTAYWLAEATTDSRGTAEVSFKMPENLSEWKFRSWALSAGTRVGEGTTSAVTAKDLLVRLQAPRFFVEQDEVVISANIHNYLPSRKNVTARLELDGKTLELITPAEVSAAVDSKGERRVDWRVRVVREGEAVLRAFALSDEESDAMELRFPVYVHGMLKTESWSGYLAPAKNSASLTVTVPRERRPEATRLEVRYSPTLALAMVDALPYLVNYPYGCTEQTLNRFLPTAVVQQTIKALGVSLTEIREKRTNLNAQEIGAEREKGWKRYEDNPVFDEQKVAEMLRAGLERLESMQLADGGWGWFTGYGEHSTPHMTAYVIHALQAASASGVTISPEIVGRGLGWLRHYQSTELQKLKNAPTKTDPYKTHADDLDAFVALTLAEGGSFSPAMRDFLYRDRNELSLYAKALLGLVLEREGEKEKLTMVLKNLRQYLIEDAENQTAYLRLPASNPWWYWYGSEIETLAYYLKLLVAAEPKGTVAPGLVKYLLNNRKHATYWNSTRDTALVLEAFTEYLRATGESKPNLEVEIYVDGKKRKEVRITPETVFSFDGTLVLEGEALGSGAHTVEFKKKGESPLYFNAYLTNFTLEDFIRKAGLEVRVDRRLYKLVRSEKAALVQGAHGQALEQQVEHYDRVALENHELVKSGDLVEVELEIDTKNDYEYLIFEDMKAAGFEPVEVRSGYTPNELGAYVEYRDERVAFFAQRLARGKYSLSYRLRAEIPGRFSALPTRASAMYAPELKANSDEFKVGVED